jgi:predicted O-methyltransferase YrrM
MTAPWAPMEAYAFTTDWFGGHIPVWKTHLAHLAGQADVQCLEIGSYEGRAVVWLLGNILTHPTARIDCIDPYLVPGTEERFDHNVRTALGQEKVRKLKGYSHVILRTLASESYDMIYIDGSHTAYNVLEDAVLSFRLLKPAGILIFDDYDWYAHDDPLLQPKIAVDAFLDIYQREIEVLHRGYQVISRKR